MLQSGDYCEKVHAVSECIPKKKIAYKTIKLESFSQLSKATTLT